MMAGQFNREHCAGPVASHGPRSLLSDRSGGVAVNFALALPFLMLLAGGVVDYSLALGDKAVAQSTADAASLAGAKALSMADTDSERRIDRGSRRFRAQGSRCGAHGEASV